MEKMKRVYSLLFAAVLLVSLFSMVGAAVTYPQQTAADIKIATNETACNITISNSTANLVSNQQMTINAQSDYANYTLSPSQTASIGDYYYYSSCGTGTFSITPSGQEFNTQQTLLTYLAFFGIILLFGLCVFFAARLDGKNYRNPNGGLTGINYKKYLGFTLWLFSYMLFNWMLNFLISISAFLSIPTFSGFFSFLFNIITANAWIAFVIYAVILIVNAVKDSKLNKILKNMEVYYG